jgi:flagellar hook-basal body complex protein FliE
MEIVHIAKQQLKQIHINNHLVNSYQEITNMHTHI